MNDGLLSMKGHEALFRSLGAVKTEIELAGFLRTLAAKFDYKGFLVVDIPTAVEDQLTPRIVLSDLPAGFIEAYDSIGLLKNSPIFASLRRSTAPLSWCAETDGGHRPLHETEIALQLFVRHKMNFGVYFPVHGFSGDRAAIGFLGDRSELTHAEMGELGIFVMHAYDTFSNLKSKTLSVSSVLTARELEVLHWAAHGKTSAEIAAIISLSDHTVNAYMNSAMRKLDCVNRTQLVAKALRLRLIS
ncbi:DNA-binding protein with HTH domain [Hoeflea sp. IMCC20628]|uniref:helix-turn-helix transcriptional regulator n=1 Tax=Hoeflea sp. IMCC20628 TaxID=1620421 RepID=UPI00063BF6C1|nr:LuxR family transcriptional regulator [Hoeflea sp. IMCC20628]AKH99333.1 DNA-binding protein with HTH domain [Hoeflea sp. IMCC20628]